MDDFDARLAGMAQTPVLLVGCDFDGTLAPIVDDPSRAEADREAMVALRALAQMPQTFVAIISGRALTDLAARVGDAARLHLVGSHGSEFEAGFVEPIGEREYDLRERLRESLALLAGSRPGFVLEEKPASLAFHYRQAEPTVAEHVVSEVLNGPAQWNGVHVRHGKKVLELSVVKTDKGAALDRLRQRLGASAVLYLGDDVTDEDVFVRLTGPDVAVKVGPGESAAGYRAAGPMEAAQVLAKVAERRSTWLVGESGVPIEEHALLSDQRTAALLSPSGRIVWMCLPRIDSSAIFAELLGGPAAGYFEVCSADGCAPLERHYEENTFTFTTRWPGWTLTDYLDCSSDRPRRRAGRSDLIRVLSGEGRVRVAFAPRLDFGRIETRLRLLDQGLAVEGSLDPLVLRCPDLRFELLDVGAHQTAVAEFDLAGRTIVLEMRYGTANLNVDPLPEAQRRRQTARYWAEWAADLVLPRIARQAALRSALVLRALCYGPTGAVAASATSSLPEYPGGVRNWDYRFCWPRDAAMSASALVRLGATAPAMNLLDWLLGILDRCEPGSLPSPVYTVTGGHLGPEAEIAELSGYRGSRPVRIGNAAAQQMQLDMFAPIVELLALLAERGAVLSSEHWRLADSMVSTVEKHWMEPDHGIWEVRRPRRHHVHSKAMCWHTVDKALRVAHYLGKQRPDWVELRDRIAAEVLERGWNAARQAFCAAYDEPDFDASALTVGLCGLVAPDDPRFRDTIRGVERHLRVGPTVLRYRYDDGLPGMEGGFHLCTCWLIEALALSGSIREAQELFELYLGLVGPVGLLSEEYHPYERRALGNYPQAYSHLGLINAALALEAAGSS